MCENGNKVIFYSKDCEIRKGKIGRIIVEGKRVDGNVYHLKDIQRTHCMMGQVYESCLWYKILGHLNFDNLMKIRTKGYVRHLPKIINTKKVICKEC